MKTLKNLWKSNRDLYRFWIVRYICLLVLFIGPPLVAQTGADNACVECHKTVVNKSILHGPAATACSSCHETNGKKHPQEGVVGFNYYAEGAELCYSCHTELQEEHDLRYKHEPLKKGECATCHEVHSSEDPKFLKARAPELCFTCHTEFKDKQGMAKTLHTASFEGDACTQCHTPHASKQKKLLLDKSRQLCLNCHNKSIKKEDGTILTNIGQHLAESSYEHKALKKKCTSCHNPHFSDRKLLLTENFTIGSYAKGIPENFTLCFDCHNPNLLKEEKTTTVTQFRTGDRNLHYVHVNKEKGRNCTTCHDIHAANNTKLIGTTVKFGRWDMPLNYIDNENGGTCATGCHKERSYSRVPVVAVE
ncbi:cytochrome c3 family protein [Lutimonas vermicola]|uniref:Cytochrome c3 family protein n=1 Tax=Lutimonas vermicola TaxID=414288 RepID=A0ABU9KY36_9FLAO